MINARFSRGEAIARANTPLPPTSSAKADATRTLSTSPPTQATPIVALSDDLNTGLERRVTVHWSSVVVISAISLTLGSCANPPATTPTPKQLQIMTTFIPITDFTKAVAGDRAQVTQLLPTNVEPHDYQAKPGDAQKLAKADVLVQNGLGIEGYLNELVKNTGNAKLKVIDSSQGIKPIATETIEGKKPKAGQDRPQYNPHIWLDPKRVIRQVENIREGLIAADPAGKEIYTNNAVTCIKKLRELDTETTKMLQPFAGKTFVAFHDFAPYFAQSYNLKANFLVDVPEDNPSPADVKRIVDTVKATNLKTLLAEPNGGTEAFAALAKDLNVRVSTFDTMETGSPEAVQSGHYITTMQANVKTLVTAFTGQSERSLVPLESPLAPLSKGGTRFSSPFLRGIEGDSHQLRYPEVMSVMPQQVWVKF
jgi:zinc transport system substrate-binding protein